MQVTQYGSNRNNINFSSIGRCVYDTRGMVKYRNDTMPYRVDLPIKKVIKDIISRKTPPKIYCYASSDGSEPYTVALELIRTLGDKKAQKYFPIIARDIDEKMVESAKSRTIGLDGCDVNYLKDKIGEHFFDSCFKQKRQALSYKEIVPFEVNHKLADCVDFQVGDVIKDTPKMDLENSVILCRNVWPYFKKEDRNTLLKTLKKQFKPTTTLVVGDFDITSTNAMPYGCEDVFYKGANLVQTSPKIFKLKSNQNELQSFVSSFKEAFLYIPNAVKNIYLSLKYNK